MADKSLPWGLRTDKLTPGSTKAISESKLKAFEVGTMNIGKKSLSKREQEEIKKKKDAHAAAQVYEEFVASFQDSGKQSKAWVKGGVVNPAEKSSPSAKPEKSKLYKPTSKLAELASTFQSMKDAKKRDDDVDDDRADYRSFTDRSSFSVGKKKKEEQKKRSNLEIFKEELKQIQLEREERHRWKAGIRNQGFDSVAEPIEDRFGKYEASLEPGFNKADSMRLGPYDPADESTTNIYVGNINPKMTEQQLCEVFGRYGPLASVKIMWPRTDEERSRGRNCGFVAFMNRKDGERAMNSLKGKEVMQFEMKLGWGKAVPIPPHPVYIPPALVELTQPPPPSGLPFNAQPSKSSRRLRSEKLYGNVPPPGINGSAKDEPAEDIEKTLAKAVVKVVIPTERNLLCVIHRMIEFVVREGPMFEAMIMNREINNPMFRFLFDNQSPAHLYYRWKMFTILQGDSPYRWRTEEFKMFKGGSQWKPPPMNPYTQGMPDELVREDLNLDQEEEVVIKKGQLTDSQRDRLEDTLRELTPERMKIGDAMVWCLDHAEAAEEIVECITESLSILQTPIPKKIARLFLVSDILFNSSAKVPNASFFRKCFQIKLREIFKDIHETYVNIDGRLKAEQFKQKVMGCFRAWEDWAIYPNDYLISLQNIFLGLVPTKTVTKLPGIDHSDSEDLDGAPIEDLDGAPLDQSKEDLDGKVLVEYDGEPYSEDLDGAPIGEYRRKEDRNDDRGTSPVAPKFLKSKWETVDDAELEAQAMTTSKWDLLDNQEEEEEEEEEKPQGEMYEDIDGQPLDDEEGYSRGTASDEESFQDYSDYHHKQEMTEERRAKLREIEVKVMKYQDELEAGKRSRKNHITISQQVEHYRKKLLQKETDSPGRDTRKRHRSRSFSPSAYRSISSSPKRGSKRMKSPKRSRRSRSRSPHKRSTSRSPSRHRHKHKKSKHRM
ncbi:U2 snRNP-associated SURP motif-containing protein-like isoform X2 [Pecten maximus]|uniref:U2 snRNP-associated SURP motif-containing protein-like isoform X2 n=1 Tax=Pecten maximus TaxID=6579 RepID=UPI0014586464|nr:U2 snRNP-associated SURP motif-containing protein-like isoform X2 [Pecten maximus]